MLRLCPILVALVFTQTTATAAVYKWVDEQGRVHFGDRTPGAGAEQVDIKPSPQSPAAAPSETERAEKRRRLLDIYREDREAKKAAAQKRREERKQRKTKCKQARLQLEDYQSAAGIYDRVEGGKRRYLSFKERDRYIEQLRQQVERWCR